MRDLTDKPFGVNIAQAFVRDPHIVDFVVDQGVRFVTTSAGDPTKYTAQLKVGGAHGVPRRADAAWRAEGRRSGRRRPGGRGRRGRRLQEPARRRDDGAAAAGRARSVDVPIIAAGGIIDGATMAAAFALGAEGIQMGTRMVPRAESPVHDNWKQAIVAAAETDTVFLNRRHSARRCARCARTTASRSSDDPGNVMAGASAKVRRCTSAATWSGDRAAGQVAGRIDAVRPVAEVIGTTVEEFHRTVDRLASGELRCAGRRDHARARDLIPWGVCAAECSAPRVTDPPTPAAASTSSRCSATSARQTVASASVRRGRR